jgi:hypothetical protein
MPERPDLFALQRSIVQVRNISLVIAETAIHNLHEGEVTGAPPR